MSGVVDSEQDQDRGFSFSSSSPAAARHLPRRVAFRNGDVLSGDDAFQAQHGSFLRSVSHSCLQQPWLVGFPPIYDCCTSRRLGTPSEEWHETRQPASQSGHSTRSSISRGGSKLLPASAYEEVCACHKPGHHLGARVLVHVQADADAEADAEAHIRTAHDVSSRCR